MRSPARSAISTPGEGSGGTAATTAAGARTNLGLAIGTDIPSPTGTGASGTWGINISGNAATATTATTATTAISVQYAVSGSAGSGGVVYENPQTITSNYTMPTGSNGMSTGPITVNSGVTVTIPDNSNWAIL